MAIPNWCFTAEESCDQGDTDAHNQGGMHILVGAVLAEFSRNDSDKGVLALRFPYLLESSKPAARALFLGLYVLTAQRHRSTL